MQNACEISQTFDLVVQIVEVLQKGLSDLRIEKHVDVEKLIKGKYAFRLMTS